MPIMPLQAAEEGDHYEILVRMRDEAGKIVSPEHFIAAAERYNIMPAIDRWVIENTLRWLVSEADERERLSMCAINLSGQSLGDDKFPALRDRTVPEERASILRRSASRSPRLRPWRASRRPTASSSRSRNSAASSRWMISAPACRHSVTSSISRSTT